MNRGKKVEQKQLIGLERGDNEAFDDVCIINIHQSLKKHSCLLYRGGKFPPCPAQQETVQRPSQTVLRVLAAAEPV